MRRARRIGLADIAAIVADQTPDPSAVIASSSCARRIGLLDEAIVRTDKTANGVTVAPGCCTRRIGLCDIAIVRTDKTANRGFGPARYRAAGMGLGDRIAIKPTNPPRPHQRRHSQRRKSWN